METLGFSGFLWAQLSIENPMGRVESIYQIIQDKKKPFQHP